MHHCGLERIGRLNNFDKFYILESHYNNLVLIEREQRLTQVHKSFCQCTACSCKGQLIPKCLFGICNSPKKRTKKFRLYYYGTSSQIIFVRFFGKIEDINWTFRNQLTFNYGLGTHDG
jgi:hypothetical protein